MIDFLYLVPIALALGNQRLAVQSYQHDFSVGLLARSYSNRTKSITLPDPQRTGLFALQSTRRTREFQHHYFF